MESANNIRMPHPAHRQFRRGLVGAAISLMLTGMISQTAQAELYRYTNEDGVIVLDSHVPARYVKNGYTILSLDGRVLEVVDRALTEEEIRERDARLAREAEEERQRKKQAAEDQNLLRMYSTPGDVIRARDTKLASIKGFINTQEGNVRRLESQKRQLESSLADIERSGGRISDSTLERIRSIEGRIASLESEIRAKEAEIKTLSATFAADLKRLKELQRRDRKKGRN